MRRYSESRYFTSEPRRDWVAGLLVLGGIFLALPSIVWMTSILTFFMGISIATMGVAEFIPARRRFAVRATRLAGVLGTVLTFLGGLLWLLVAPDSFLSS